MGSYNRAVSQSEHKVKIEINMKKMLDIAYTNYELL